MRDDGLQVLENADGKRTVDGWEVVEKLGQRPVVFQVVQQGADGHTCSDEHGRPAQKFGIGVYAWYCLVHGASHRGDASSIRPRPVHGVANDPADKLRAAKRTVSCNRLLDRVFAEAFTRSGPSTRHAALMPRVPDVDVDYQASRQWAGAT